MAAPLVFDDLAATVLVFGPLVGSVFVEHRRFRGDREARLGDRSYRRLQAWQLAGLVLGVLATKYVPGAALPGNEWLWVGLGCAVGLAGAALRFWAIRTLGAHFTRNLQIADDHRVVDGGPYRLVRHPSYTGSIVMFLGIGIGLGNALGLVALAVLPTVGYVERIPREEALLRRELGAPYDAYAGRTKRLVPGIW